MRVLVSVASKHGATTEIGETIADVLQEHEADLTVAPPDKVTDIDSYDAVVLGSAVYMGRWLTPAKRLVSKHRERLASRSVWLFSSRPIGDPAMPRDKAVDIPEMMRATAVRVERSPASWTADIWHWPRRPSSPLSELKTVTFVIGAMSRNGWR